MTRDWFELEDKIFDSHQLAVRLIDLAIQRGANRDALLRGTGIFYQDIQQKNIKLNSQQVFKLIANAEKQVNSNDLSFLLGRRLFPSNIGSTSQLLSNCRNLNDMLRMIQCFQMLLFPFLSLQVKHHTEQTFLIITPAIAGNEQERFFTELLCTAIHGACKWQLGHTIPLHFHFEFSRPRNIYQYEENLGYRLHFNQPLPMIAVDNKWLNQPMPDSSSLVRQQQRQENQKQRDMLPFRYGLLQCVCQHIQRHYNATLEDTAGKMQMSPATLKRKLKQHGSSFQKLQDQVRKQQAIFDLKIKRLGNKEVAEKLGFSDLPNFRRAFKRWTGMTPGELREKE